MNHISIKRVSTSKKDGTLGVLLFNDIPRCLTLEPPDLNNEKFISCIPPGEYTAQLHHSKKFGDVYCLQDVPDRTQIYIHAGNFKHQTLGCILPGQSISRDHQGQFMVTNSRSTLTNLMLGLKDGEHYPDAQVEILKCYL